VLRLVAEVRGRAAFFAFLWVPPAVLALGRDRSVPPVRLPRVFFEALRPFVTALPDRDPDEPTDALPPEGDRDERAGVSPPREGASFELANRISRTSSIPAATVPRIMPARSSCLTAVRTLPTARCSATMFRREAPFFGL
jgi:hypothetical protein